MQRVSLAIVVLGALGAGCGARTELLDLGSHSSDGAGGSDASMSSASMSSASTSPVTSSSGAGAAGTGGGPSVVCPTLVVDPQVGTIATVGYHLVRPELVAIGTPGVSVVYNATIPNAVPVDASTKMSMATFDPWHVWPPVLAPLVIHYANTELMTLTERPFAISRAPDSDDGAFQIAHSIQSSSAYPCAKLNGNLTPAASENGGCHSLGYDLLSTAQRVGAKRRLVLGSTPAAGAPGGVTLASWLVGAGPTPKASLVEVGCALSPTLEAGVVATSDAWLVAGALGAPFSWFLNDCATTADPLGRARGVYTGHVASDGLTFSGNEQLAAENEDVTGFGIAASDDGGAFIAWGVEAGSASSAARVARIDENAHTALGAVTLAQASGAVQPTSVGLAAMGSRAIVAVVEATGDTERIVVHQIDPNGAELAAGIIPVVGTASGAVAVVADPSEGIVVAWSELDPGATEEVLRVAKLTCSGGP